MAKFTAVFNTSPLIFLAKLGYIDAALSLFNKCYAPDIVINEITEKDDEIKAKIETLLIAGKIIKKKITHPHLFERLNEYVDIGESQAITLGVEIEPDFIVLDDNAARREARKVGLKVIGSLGLIKKLNDIGTITVNDRNAFYSRLQSINFRIRRSVFDAIFEK